MIPVRHSRGPPNPNPNPNPNARPREWRTPGMGAGTPCINCQFWLSTRQCKSVADQQKLLYILSSRMAICVDEELDSYEGSVLLSVPGDGYVMQSGTIIHPRGTQTLALTEADSNPDPDSNPTLPYQITKDGDLENNP